MIVIGIDPGKTTGVAEFVVENRKATPRYTDQLNQDEFNEWLVKATYEGIVEVIVCEDFILDPKKAEDQGGSRMEASQIIGAVRYACALSGTRLVTQAASIKPIAQKWTKLVPPSDHSKSHWIDAYNHAIYWLVESGRIDLNVKTSR